MINAAHNVLLELVFIALSVLHRVDSGGPETTFYTVPEILTQTLTDITMCLAVPLFIVVGRSGQHLGRQICLLYDSLRASHPLRSWVPFL